MTERELIEGCIKMDAKSQHRLFEQYSGRMMTVCLRYSYDQKEAEDILQESFIKVFQHIGQYKFEGAFEGWIRRIVVNTALNLIKKKKIRFSEINEDLEVSQSTDADIIAHLSAGEILKLISHLPDGYRLVFNLYVLEGYDHQEIAELLQINAGTSRSQLLKARKLLKSQIENLKKLPTRYV